MHNNIIYIVKPTKCTNVSNLFYFGMTLYMFRTVFPSIITSSRLCMQQQPFVKQILLSAWPSGIHNWTHSNRHLSNRYCWLLDHQEFKTVHAATSICQTDSADCLLASSQQYLFDICLLPHVQSWTPGDGREDRPKHVECHSKIK